MIYLIMLLVGIGVAVVGTAVAVLAMNNLPNWLGKLIVLVIICILVFIIGYAVTSWFIG
jgi:uncharacterized membrane protein YkvI